MKTLISVTAGAVLLLNNGVALAQTGTMMGGDHSGFGWMGGYGGGGWIPFALIVVVVALAALVFRRGDK